MTKFLIFMAKKSYKCYRIFSSAFFKNK